MTGAKKNEIRIDFKDINKACQEKLGAMSKANTLNQHIGETAAEKFVEMMAMKVAAGMVQGADRNAIAIPQGAIKLP